MLAFSVANAVGLGVVLVCNGVWGSRIGRVSGAYETPFTPASWTFAVWGPIYVLLIAAVTAQFYDARIVSDWGPFFVLQCAATVGWLVSFTSQWTRLSALFLAGALVFVGICYAKSQRWRTIRSASPAQRVVSVAFSFYFGWILLATILNGAVAFRVSEASVLLRSTVWICVVASVVTTQATLLDPVLGITTAWGALGTAIRYKDPVAAIACAALVASFVGVQATSIVRSD